MCPSPSFHPTAHRLRAAGLLAVLLALTGATTGAIAIAPQTDAPAEAPAHIAPAPEPEPIPVVRHGRYTLVELVPEPAQRDLMRQVVEVVIPPAFDASVGDALRHILLRTGYRPCDTTDAATLYALPLPAAHLRLGPLPLRDALTTLAGPAWALSVDNVTRRVCFERIPSASVPTPERAESMEPGEVQP